MDNNTDMMGDNSDGAMRRATIVVCANSGTEVPRYRMNQQPDKLTICLPHLKTAPPVPRQGGQAACAVKDSISLY